MGTAQQAGVNRARLRWQLYTILGMRGRQGQQGHSTGTPASEQPLVKCNELDVECDRQEIAEPELGSRSPALRACSLPLNRWKQVAFQLTSW
eukprot:1157510-Pelagomonas_calceolata.AAC.19